MYRDKKIDFKWFYGGMAVLFTMIPSHSKTQVFIDNLPFFCFPLVILLNTVNFQVETHSGGRNVLGLGFFFPSHLPVAVPRITVCLLKEEAMLRSYQ